MKDYYQILSILETASQEDIRQAYLRMALIWHPDRHAGESPDRLAIVTACFQEISEAYGVLSDPVKKNDYDWWLRRSRLTPTMRPTGSSASTPTARTSAGWPSSYRRQSSQESGSRNGTGRRTDSSYSRTRNWGANYTGSQSTDTATRKRTISSMVSDFIFDILRFVWNALFACVLVVNCGILIYKQRMGRLLNRRLARRRTHKQACSA